MFEDKKKGLEKKIDLDTQKKFKITAIRNKSLGKWAAEQLSLKNSKIDEYINEVIVADFEEPGFVCTMFYSTRVGRGHNMWFPDPFFLQLCVYLEDLTIF